MSEPITNTDPRKGWTSASNALADSLCRGRHNAQKGIPEPPKDADATSGTLIHQALATESEPNKLTLEQRETFDACREIEKRVAKEYFGAENTRIFRHRRFWCRVSKMDKTVLMHSGEADVVYRGGTRLLVMDYKTLSGDVQESPRNLQLRDLAVLAWGELAPITEVAVAVVQPFVTHTPEVCVYTAEDLNKAAEEMFGRIVFSNDPNARRVAGEEQCKFCLAAQAGKCADYQQWSAGSLTLIPALDVPLSSWTPAQLARAAEALAPAYDFLDNLKAYLKEHVPPGWMLQPGSKRETIINAQECFTRFAAKGGTLEQFMACITVGKTKLKERLNEVTGQKGIGLEKELKGLTEGITDIGQNAPSLRRVKE